MVIKFSSDIRLTKEKFKELLINSTLSERRPVDKDNILQKMVTNADIFITAWDNKKLVGVARSISDFSYCTYISDLAVHKDYQRKGIGKKLVSETQKLVEKDSLVFLISAPGTNEYYPKIGFKKIERAWILDKIT